MAAISTVPVEHSEQFKTEMAVYFEFRQVFVDRPDARIFIRDDPRYDGKVLQVCLSEWYWDPPLDPAYGDYDPSDPGYRNGGVRTYTLPPLPEYCHHPATPPVVLPVVTHRAQQLNIYCVVPTYIRRQRTRWRHDAEGFRQYYNHKRGLEPHHFKMIRGGMACWCGERVPGL